MSSARALLLVLVFAQSAAAVDLRIEYGALERMLTDAVFTQEGRRYVHGNKSAKCDFAYLENPHIRAENGRLRITAHFTGRKALNLMGQCVGLGDAFDVIITATPQFRNGAIGLIGVTAVSAGRTGFYIGRVCSALSSSLGRDFRYPIAVEAQKLLEDPGAQPAYRRELRNFRIPEIRVTGDALVLVVDFELTVK